MMKKPIVLLFVVSILVMSGCSEKPQEVSGGLTCADYERVTDKAARNDLLKKCPRLGPAFKPSNDKGY